MKIRRTVNEINEKIKKGEAVILTAEEVKRMTAEQGVEKTARKVDVVTTATFAPMCSSGAFINFGHSQPPIKIVRAWLNDVPVFSGLAAVDAYIGATEVSESDAEYGGAHVIEALIAGKPVRLRAIGKGTDCYPRKRIETQIRKEDLNECFLFNPRNAYQNYAAATNSTDQTMYTYMGILLPKFGNATYSTSGEWSPLLNDPDLRTVGIGTKVFLGGAPGFVAWSGTQCSTGTPKNEKGIPIGPAATLSVVGDLKRMTTDFLRAAVFEKYGVSLFVGIGVPIPILDEDMARRVSIRDEDIETTLCDYGIKGRPSIARVTYRDLKSGRIQYRGKTIRTGSMSSVYKARQIAVYLKEWIQRGDFLITEPVESLPNLPALKKLAVRKE